MAIVHQLPHVNASLNLLATLFLVCGYICIRRRNEVAHRRLMLASFLTSVLFFTSYVIYHSHVPSKKFPSTAPGAARAGYCLLLASHVVLAATVPFLAARTLYLGLRDDRARHRRWARWTFPIWLYVSVTGVLVYSLLYWVYADGG
jgi:uncharacterized membrane protein YozB (DUF420 family)